MKDLIIDASISPLTIVCIVLLPFVIGIIMGLFTSFIMKKTKSSVLRFALTLISLCLSTLCGLLIDINIFKSFSLNYLLIGIAFSGTVANILTEEELLETLNMYNPILNISLVIVIVNLGMPLDYHLIAGAGVFTVIYIVSRAIGKTGGAYIGGKLTGACTEVTRYIGLTLLPHSGVSLVFTGIAVTTLTSIAPSLASIVSGTIVAAAIINEVIAVIAARFAFKWAGEIEGQQNCFAIINYNAIS